MDGMTSRIVNANSAELLLITYEITIDSIENAIKNINNDKEFKRYINKSQSLVQELMRTLNMTYEISLELMQLYLFVNKSLIQAFTKREIKHLEEGKKVLNILKSGWASLSSNYKKEQAPAINNAQKVVAGLTYGRGSLNESVMNNGSNRGFTA